MTDEVSSFELKRAVECQHGGTAIAPASERSLSGKEPLARVPQRRDVTLRLLLHRRAECCPSFHKAAAFLE
jgi:hypothetical protein